MNKELIKELNMGHYLIRHENWWHGDGDEKTLMKAAYTPDGVYIGDLRTARYLVKKRGITQLLKRTPDSNIASIGYNPTEKKWYGWSHRAMFGFGKGSSVKRGDCGYHAVNKEDFLKECIRFWSGDDHLEIKAYEHTNEDGVLGVQVEWKYGEVPNSDLVGKINSVFSRYPDTWGRGEWMAKTLLEAKTMAEDFAMGVS